MKTKILLVVCTITGMAVGFFGTFSGRVDEHNLQAKLRIHHIECEDIAVLLSMECK